MGTVAIALARRHREAWCGRIDHTEHPELITPICQVAYREGLGSGVTPEVAARIPGGLDGLATDFCRDLGPYVQGTAINRPQLYQDRGRKTFVAIAPLPPSTAPSRTRPTRSRPPTPRSCSPGCAAVHGMEATSPRMARSTTRRSGGSRGRPCARWSAPGEIHVRQSW